MGELFEWKLKDTVAPFTTSKLVSLPCTVKEARSKLKEECGLQHVEAIEFVLYLDSMMSKVLHDEFEFREASRVLVKRCSAAEARKLMQEASCDPIAETNVVADPDTKKRKLEAASITAGNLPSQHVDASGPHKDDLVPQPPFVVDRNLKSSSSTKESTEQENDALDGTKTDSAEHAPSESLRSVHFQLEEDEALESEEYYASYQDHNEERQDEENEDDRIQAAMQEKDVYGGGGQDQTTRRYYRNRVARPESMPPSGETVQHTQGSSYHPQRIKEATGAQAVQKAPFVDAAVYEVVPVNENYICHMCGQRGHHIRNCHLQEGKRQHKKIRPATGIPVDFLEIINEDDIGKYEEVYQLKSGKMAVMKDMATVSGGAFFTKSADKHIQSQLGISETGSKNLLRELSCIICNKLYKDPVATPCCGESYCIMCILEKPDATVTKDVSNIYRCPNCERVLNHSELQVNRSLKGALEALVLKKDELARIAEGVPSSESVEGVEIHHGIEVKKDAFFSLMERQKIVVSEYLHNRAQRH